MNPVLPEQLALRCGATLAVVELPWAESFSLGIFVGTGARHDPGPLPGLAHFAEHLFFKGTVKRTARQLNLEIESQGGSADAFTSEEHTVYSVRGPAGQWEQLTEVLCDMFLSSSFPSDEVERERAVICEEISMYQEQPASQAEDLLCRALWPDHPLGRPIAGDEASVTRIRRADLVNHARSAYRVGNVVFAAAGKVERSALKRVLDQILAKRLKTGFSRKKCPAPKKSFPKGPVLRHEKRELDQCHIALGCLAPGRVGTAPYVLRLLNVLLGENTTSMLWQEVREKRGWCYQIDSEITTLSDTGALQIYAGVDAANTQRAVDLIWRQMQRLAAKPVSAKTLARAKAYACGAGLLALEGSSHLMLWMGESLLCYGKLSTVAQAQQRLQSITAEEVWRLAREIFQPDRCALVTVGPVAAASFIPG